MAKQYAELTVIPGEEPPAKDLVEVFVASIIGAQASLLVSILGQSVPLGNLDHLKRIRKHPDRQLSQLQIILCAKQPPAESSKQSRSSSTTQQATFPETGASSPVPSATQTDPTAEAQPAAPTYADTKLLNPCQPAALPAPGFLAGLAQNSMIADQGTVSQQQAEQYSPPLPDKVAALVKQHQLKIQLVQVPKHAPASREQWKEWNQVWPISWRKPELTAVTAATAAAQAVTVSEQHLMRVWMDRAYALAEANASFGHVCNAAVIVDPLHGEVIAEGQDCTSRHPLKHALMVAIDAAAARDRQLWPTKGDDAATAGIGRPSCSQTDMQAAVPNSTTAGHNELGAQVKKRRISAASSSPNMAMASLLSASHQETEQQMSHSALEGSQRHVENSPVAK
ncbi:hypothetical protein ABBQ32_006865 [Trebouxia sp. C0010 RCD-2024]